MRGRIDSRTSMIYILICLFHFFVLFLPYWEAVFREKKKNIASAHTPVFQIYFISSTHLPPYLFHNNYVKNIWRNFSSLASKVSSLLVTLILKKVLLHELSQRCRIPSAKHITASLKPH